MVAVQKVGSGKFDGGVELRYTEGTLSLVLYQSFSEREQSLETPVLFVLVPRTLRGFVFGTMYEPHHLCHSIA